MRFVLVFFSVVASTILGMQAFGYQVDPPYGDIGTLKIEKPADKEDVASTPAPSDATVLFDGTNLDAWKPAKGEGQNSWKLVDGKAVQVVSGDLVTKEFFDGHFKLHIEFRVPYMPDKQGQGRGNSGVYLQGRYEVQVLDSYGLDSKDNDCGGIYQIAKPLVNACKAPTIWQSYDIDFKSPVYSEGKKSAPARISVVQNGETIHKDVAIPLDNTVSGLGGDPSLPGPIMLQDHGNPVQYRNIWIQRIK